MICMDQEEQVEKILLVEKEERNVIKFLELVKIDPAPSFYEICRYTLKH